MTGQPADQTTTRRWLAIAALGAAVFVVTTTEMTPMGVLPAIARDLRVSEGRAGLSVSTYGLLAGLVAPPATILTGRIDRRTLILTILAVFTVGNALSAASHTYTLFMASRFTSGLMHGLMWAIVTTIALNLVARRDAARATAIVFSGISLALVIGVPGGAYLGGMLGWRSAFAALSALSAITFILVRTLLPPLPRRRPFAFCDLMPLLASRRVRGVLLVTAGVVIGNYGAYTYVAPFLVGAHGVDLNLIGGLLLCHGTAGVAGNFVSGMLLGRFRTIRNVLAGLTVALTASLLLASATQALLLLTLWFITWGMAYSALPVALQTLVLEVGGDGRGEAASSLYVLVFNCAIAGGAAVGGVAIDNVGAAAPMWVGAAFCGLSLIAIRALRDTSHHLPGSSHTATKTSTKRRRTQHG